MALDKGVRFVNNIPETMKLYCDYGLLGRVIDNLVFNAAKFCRQGDTISVFTPDDRPNVIAVRDSGPGIAEELLPDLFLGHVRTSTEGSAGEVGSGLGLPICREIVHAHDGALTVESVRGEGATFFIELPAVKPRLLLIDDEEDFADLFRAAVMDTETEVLAAYSGEEALQIIDDARPHLIVCDLLLPGIDGVQVIRQFKTNPRTAHIPILVITGSIPQLRDVVLEIGVNDFLSKPFTAYDIRRHIQRFLP